MKRVYKGLKAHGQSALRTHAVGLATTARAALGDPTGAGWVERLLALRAVVRYPTTLAFGDDGRAPGTFGRVIDATGDGPRAFHLVLASRFADLPATWPLLVPYYVPTINYGAMATAEDALAFGAALLGVTEDEYYAALEPLSDAR